MADLEVIHVFRNVYTGDLAVCIKIIIFMND